MIKNFIKLEWKSFLRSASFGSNVVMKIFMVLGALYFMAIFLLLGFASYPLLQDSGLPPFPTVNKYLIYFFVLDLVVRYFLQKMPVLNIKPLLVLPISRSKIVNYCLGKTAVSFFNWVHIFFFVPFSIMLIKNNFNTLEVFTWMIGMFFIVYINNFINVLINNKDVVFYSVVATVGLLGVAQYYQWFDVTLYTAPFFESFYHKPYMVLFPLLLIALLYYFAYQYFASNLNLDEGLASKSEIAKTEDFTFLDQFGTLGTFLKNDIRMLKRNKRSRTTLIMSVLFVFYGLLFYTNSIEAYNNPAMRAFAGIFVSGGFLFTFGQFVPSWDSAYYQLMMSQNIQYKDYLASKWWLMVIGTVLSTILASFYLYFGLETYLLIVVGAIFNIGVNSHLVMLGGAFVKTPIDLSSSKQAFGDKQAFNLKTLLISLPKLVLPMALYALGYYLFSPNIGLLFVALAGVLGFVFKDYVFTKIESIYKTEKYSTIASYKQKN